MRVSAYWWPEEKTKVFLKMARLGHTSYEIAKVLGKSRSSICAKASRLGITLRGKPFGAVNCAKWKPRKKIGIDFSNSKKLHLQRQETVL